MGETTNTPSFPSTGQGRVSELYNTQPSLDRQERRDHATYSLEATFESQRMRGNRRGSTLAKLRCAWTEAHL